MKSQIVMVGTANFSGQTVNGLNIGNMVQRHGPGNEPVYQSECSICKSRSTATQRDLRNDSARCRAAGCGRTVVTRQDRASELARQARQREAEAQRLRDEASAARMASETQDHKVTSSRPPVSDDPGPMTERQRIEIRAHREEQETIERAEREAREAPLKAAQAKLLETHRELEKVERERLEATVRDPDVFSDPVLRGVSTGESEADQFNRNEFARFRADHPGLYVTGELIDSLGRYFEKNGQALVSAAMLDRAIARFKNAGLLSERPAPQPVVKRAETPAPAPAKPLTYVGRDPQTGREREFTAREVDRMSSDEYRKTFQVLDSVGELFTLQSRLRGR